MGYRASDEYLVHEPIDILKGRRPFISRKAEIAQLRAELRAAKREQEQLRYDLQSALLLLGEIDAGLDVDIKSHMKVWEERYRGG
jgi:hypothetical protein